MLDSEVETFVTVVASEATDDETLASDVFVLERPVLSWVTMDDVLDSEVDTLLTTLLTALMSDASEEIWLEIELDSPGVSWALAAVAPSHEVTPVSSFGRGRGTPIA